MNNILGSVVKYPKKYSPDILFGIDRNEARNLHNIDSSSFLGYDWWRCYETSWLSNNNIPQVGILNISYPSSSPQIVESKSLKLYLGSLNFHKFNFQDDLIALIQSDLSPILGIERDVIGISITRIEEDCNKTITLPGICIDNLTPVNNLSTNTSQAHEILHSNLLRSICPVTGQPDWGSVIISYKGAQLSHEGLLGLILSFREHQGFHEECCELLFKKIIDFGNIHELCVTCLFCRRGGIEINPVRCSTNIIPPDFIYRSFRQ